MTPLSEAELIEAAARGVGKVDRDGPRGATLVSTEEIIAMALLLAISGLKPIPPGAYRSPSAIPHTEGERV